MLMAAMLYIILVTITQSQIVQLAPIIVIMILIIAAAGLTRQADIFSLFGIGALFGFTGSIGKGGSGRGFGASNIRNRVKKGFAAAAGKSFGKLGSAAKKTVTKPIATKLAARAASAANTTVMANMIRSGMVPMSTMQGANARPMGSATMAQRQKLAFLQQRISDLQGQTRLSLAEKATLWKLRMAAQGGTTKIAAATPIPIVRTIAVLGQAGVGGLTRYLSAQGRADREQLREDRALVKQHMSTLSPAQQSVFRQQLSQTLTSEPSKPLSFLAYAASLGGAVAGLTVLYDVFKHGPSKRSEEAKKQNQAIFSPFQTFNKGSHPNPMADANAPDVQVRMYYDSSGKKRYEITNSDEVNAYLQTNMEDKAKAAREAQMRNNERTAREDAIKKHVEDKLGLEGHPFKSQWRSFALNNYRTQFEDSLMTELLGKRTMEQIKDRAKEIDEIAHQRDRVLSEVQEEAKRKVEEARREITAKTAQSREEAAKADVTKRGLIQLQTDNGAEFGKVQTFVNGPVASARNNANAAYDAVSASTFNDALNRQGFGSVAEEKALKSKIVEAMSANGDLRSEMNSALGQMQDVRTGLGQQTGRIRELRQHETDMVGHMEDAVEHAQGVATVHTELAEAARTLSEHAAEEVEISQGHGTLDNHTFEDLLNARKAALADEKEEIENVQKGGALYDVHLPPTAPIHIQHDDVIKKEREVEKLAAQNTAAVAEAEDARREMINLETQARAQEIRARRTINGAIARLEKLRERAEKDNEEADRSEETLQKAQQQLDTQSQQFQQEMQELRDRDVALQELLEKAEERIKTAQGVEEVEKIIEPENEDENGDKKPDKK